MGIINTLLEISILDVAKKFGIELDAKGGEYYALCPFHTDKRKGSFTINEQKGIYKCFACGAYGDAINFYSKLSGLSGDAALKEMANDFSHNGILKSNYTPKKRVKKDRSPIADIDTRNDIYSMFMSCAILTKEHLLELQKRGISIKEYKSMPTKKIFSEFLSQIKEKYGTHDVLNGIPGFYKNPSGRWDYLSMKGIMIPILDEKRRISAIQIRRDTKTTRGLRYLWFSSTFIYKNKKFSTCKYGSGPGSPVDVMMVEKPKFIFITEGKFKSEAICSTYPSISISVQGVSSWRAAVNKLKDMEAEGMLPTKTIIIAFDSDFNTNNAVCKNLRDLSNELTSLGYSARVALWDIKYGKGIDDLLLSGHGKMVRSEIALDVFKED